MKWQWRLMRRFGTLCHLSRSCFACRLSCTRRGQPRGHMPSWSIRLAIVRPYRLFSKPVLFFEDQPARRSLHWRGPHDCLEKVWRAESLLGGFASLLGVVRSEAIHCRYKLQGKCKDLMGSDINCTPVILGSWSVVQGAGCVRSVMRVHASEILKPAPRESLK